MWRLELHEIESGWYGWLEPAHEERHDVTVPLFHVLGRLGLPLPDDELIRLFAEVLQGVLPEMRLSIRLIDPETGEVLHLYASGQLREACRVVTLSKPGLERFGTPSNLHQLGLIELSEDFEPVFEETFSGFDIPIHDGDRLLGVMSFEYSEPCESMDDDRELVAPVALHLTGALSNSRKLGESLHLREYLGSLLDRANAPILVMDRNRRIKIINQSFERLTGYSRTEVRDTDVMKILTEDDRERFLPAIINALRGESTGSLEVRIPRKDGLATVRIALSTAAIKSGYGEIDGVVAVGQDLTELRQLQQQVIHSEKLATIGQLAAGVVHELNNPLTSISIYSDFLRKKTINNGGDPADLSKLERICEGAERILRFTRDLTTYARPTGEEPRLVRLRDVVEQALVFCEHVIDRCKVEVTTFFDEDLLPVYGVEGHLQQVLVNLITNACDAMDGNNGRLRIEAHSVDDRVRLLLVDNGPGVPQREREWIFEPFVSTKAEGKGTGLGLSIVRNIITNHNGTVRVEETEGGGATFVVELFAGA
jgi:PAS domain S-box-containing protein